MRKKSDRKIFFLCHNASNFTSRETRVAIGVRGGHHVAEVTRYPFATRRFATL